jgi:hypothetical protein
LLGRRLTRPLEVDDAIAEADVEPIELPVSATTA